MFQLSHFFAFGLSVSWNFWGWNFADLFSSWVVSVLVCTLWNWASNKHFCIRGQAGEERIHCIIINDWVLVFAKCGTEFFRMEETFQIKVWLFALIDLWTFQFFILHIKSAFCAAEKPLTYTSLCCLHPCTSNGSHPFWSLREFKKLM